MEMEDQYGLSDLRQFITRATVAQFPPYPPQPTLPSSSDLFSAQQQPYEMVVLGRNMSVPTTVDMLHHHQQQHNNTTTTTTIGVGFHHHKDHHHFNSDSTTTTATPTTNSGGFDGGDGGAARWPRQETLTLLEVRSRLDHKFKEANQKGPLWDEVARIMCEEHGYQRTGKKCREKFENLYKYYKKTKEGKAGRQDGKHYRFFRQLEALYGDHTNNTPHHHHHNHHPMVSASEAGHHIAGNIPHFNNNNHPHGSMPSFELCANENQILRPGSSVSLSTTSDFDTSSSDNEVGGSMESDESKKKKKSKRNWKVKIKEFIDHQMRNIMEKQEAWLDKMMTSFENREKERIQREDTWRNHENERVEREHKFWANERAWIEARDSALMSALEKITNSRNHLPYCDHHHHNCRDDDNNSNNNNIIINNNQWLENEVTRLIQLRTSMESRFQQCGFSEEVLWEDIATKMAYLGYDRSASVCKEKWDNINKYFQEKDVSIRDESNKKRKEHYGEVSNNNVNNHNNNVNSNNVSHCHSNNNYNNNEGGGGLYMKHLGGFISSNCEINEPRVQLNEGSSSSPSSHNSNANVNVNVNANANANANTNAGNISVGGGSVMNDISLRFFLGDGEGLGWEGNYGMKLNKNGGNHCA